MAGRLTLDFTSGVTLAGAPFLFVKDENSVVKNTLMAVGLFEIGASLLTQTA